MNTYQLDNVNDKLLAFVNECNDLNYNNNNSLKALKFEWCLDTGGMWYATEDQNRIISLSGIHPFKDGYRALFRGAQVYPRPIGINRYHLQSHCWYYQLPLQLEFAKENPVYITTNIKNDASGKMTRIDKTFHHLAKSNIVSHVATEEVFYTLQNVWLLNKENYNAIRF